MKDMSPQASDLELVKFLELEDEIRDQVRQKEFQEQKHKQPLDFVKHYTAKTETENMLK